MTEKWNLIVRVAKAKPDDWRYGICRTFGNVNYAMPKEDTEEMMRLFAEGKRIIVDEDDNESCYGYSGTIVKWHVEEGLRGE